MKKKHTMRNVILILLAIAAAGGYYFVSHQDASAMYNEITATTRDIETYYTFSGNIEPDSYQVVVATARGTVKELLLEEGDEVKKDDFVIAPKSGNKFKAPMDGTISDIFVDVDDTFNPGDPLFRVADYSHPRLRIKVDEYDVDAIEKGMKVTVNVHALDAELEGEVVRLAQEATVANDIAYYEAIIEMPQDGKLRMGMTCEVVVLRESAEDVVAVPVDAIRYDDNGKPFVYCYNRDKEIVTQSVLLGVNDGTYVEIMNGISSGETILKPKSALESLPMMNLMPMR